MSQELQRRGSTLPEQVTDERWITPAVDVYESEKEWMVRADVPGVIESNLQVHLDKGELTLQARREETPFEDVGYVGYRRSFALPSGIDAKAAAAEIRHGVVTIRLPKHESLRPRQIVVRAG